MISLLIVTYNEERRLEACLQHNRKFVDEIVVIDQSSTDRTGAIARALADVVLIDPHYGYCERSRPRALAAARNEWLLVLDADEWIDYPEADVLRRLSESGEIQGYFLWRASDIGDERVADEQLYRLFRRDAVVLEERLHSAPQPAPGAARAFSPYPPIRHAKSVREHEEDHARYVALGYDFSTYESPRILDSSTARSEVESKISLVIADASDEDFRRSADHHRGFVDEIVPGMPAASGDWVMLLAADERLDYPDRAILRTLIETPELDAFFLWRASDADGERIADEKVCRFFKRGSIQFPADRSVFEPQVPTGVRYGFCPVPIIRRQIRREESYPARLGNSR